ISGSPTICANLTHLYPPCRAFALAHRSCSGSGLRSVSPRCAPVDFRRPPCGALRSSREEPPMALRFNHMELTLPPGALDADTRAEIKRFYGEVFGWNAIDVPILGQEGLLLRTDAETSQFVLIVESK